jgi:hypothetical protein
MMLGDYPLGSLVQRYAGAAEAAECDRYYVVP